MYLHWKLHPLPVLQLLNHTQGVSNPFFLCFQTLVWARKPNYILASLPFLYAILSLVVEEKNIVTHTECSPFFFLLQSSAEGGWNPYLVVAHIHIVSRNGRRVDVTEEEEENEREREEIVRECRRSEVVINLRFEYPLQSDAVHLVRVDYVHFLDRVRCHYIV